MVSFSSILGIAKITVTQLKTNVTSNPVFQAVSDPSVLGFLASTSLSLGLFRIQSMDFISFEHRKESMDESRKKGIHNAIRESEERVIISFESKLEETLKQHLNQVDVGNNSGWWFVTSSHERENKVLQQKLSLAKRKEEKYMEAVEGLATILVDLGVQDDAKKAQIEKVLISVGVKKFTPSVGDTYDPSQHHVVCEFPDPRRSPGIIARVFQDGYMLQDRIFYPAQVGVTRDVPTGRKRRVMSKS